MKDDIPLYIAVRDGNICAVEAALENGANINGHLDQPFAPIAVATLSKHEDIVKCLLERGADPEKRVTLAVLLSSGATAATLVGARALHIAIATENIKIIRLLLKGSGADPNATDGDGCTPLMVACACRGDNVEVVLLLLEAGADPALANKRGSTPLHMAANHRITPSVDILFRSAPDTLNYCTSDGLTPLYMACSEGHESVVSKLLELGAMQLVLTVDIKVCPLAVAVQKGFMGVVRVLINEGGIRAVGGGMALRNALTGAVCLRRAGILRLLLTVEGEERRSKLSNSALGGSYLLHHGTYACHSKVVSVLLEAGADETARDSEGKVPRDSIGLIHEREVDIDRGEEIAIRRMLQRGPAYRARSWAWPADIETDGSDAGACESAFGAVGAANAARGVVIPTPQTDKHPPGAGVRIFRPNKNSSSTFFSGRIGRYCAKD